MFAEFRWALSCRLKSDLNLHKDIVQNIDDKIINTNKDNEFYSEEKIDEQPNDIYNYHKYSYETGDVIQTKDFTRANITQNPLVDSYFKERFFRAINLERIDMVVNLLHENADAFLLK